MVASTLALLMGLAAPAAASCTPARPGEAVRVHVLTTSPGQKLFNSQGHSALWVSGGALKQGMVYNWGAFDGSQSGIVPKFLAGTLPYWVAAERYSTQWKRVVAADRTLVAQRLDLPAEAATQIQQRLIDNAKPENRDYIYHYATRNCATQVRDVIDDAIGGQLELALKERPVDWTGRFDGGRNLAPWPALWFAWDFMVSSYLDQPLTEWEAAMVPERLMESLRDVTFTARSGAAARPLVAETCMLREGEWSWARPAPLPYWPIVLASVALSGGAVALGRLRRQKRSAGVLAGLLLLVPTIGLALLGTVTAVIWSISQLDGVGPTENWFVGNPLTWLLLGPVVRILRGKPLTRRARFISWGLAGLGVLGLVVKPLPWFSQDNVGPLLTWLPILLAVAALAWLDRTEEHTP